MGVYIVFYIRSEYLVSLESSPNKVFIEIDIECIML